MVVIINKHLVSSERGRSSCLIADVVLPVGPAPIATAPEQTLVAASRAEPSQHLAAAAAAGGLERTRSPRICASPVSQRTSLNGRTPDLPLSIGGATTTSAGFDSSARHSHAAEGSHSRPRPTLWGRTRGTIPPPHAASALAAPPAPPSPAAEAQPRAAPSAAAALRRQSPPRHQPLARRHPARGRPPRRALLGRTRRPPRAPSPGQGRPQSPRAPRPISRHLREEARRPEIAAQRCGMGPRRKGGSRQATPEVQLGQEEPELRRQA